MKDNIDKYLPLSTASLHILLALAGGDLHGYGIMQEIEQQSDGNYKLGPGTLYDNLQKLLADGLVESTIRRDAPSSRGRHYRLTFVGRGVLTADISRLESAFRKAKLQLNFGKPGRA